MIANKAEIRIFYETHELKPKEVSTHFNISYRTLAHWIKTEGWERGIALKALQTANLNKKLLKKEFASTLSIESKKIKDTLKENISHTTELSTELKDSLLDLVSEEVLLQALTTQALQKNIIQMAMIGKAELLRILKNREDSKGDAMIIACAEKVEKMFIDAQNCFYGKSATMAIIDVSTNDTDLTTLSTAELKAQLKQLQAKEQSNEH